MLIALVITYMTRKFLIAIFLVLQFVIFAQQEQWRASFSPIEIISEGPFLKEFGSTGLITIYLSLDNNSKKTLNLTSIDKCGQNATTVKLEGLNFNPNWLLDAVTDTFGNLYICGLVNDTQPNGVPFIIKITPQLTVSWAKVYENYKIYPYVFDINANNELFILFNTDANNHGNGLLKLTSNGQVIWGKSYGFSPIWGRGGTTSDGGFLHSTGSIIYKTNGSGVMQWRSLIPIAHLSTKLIEIESGYIFYQGYPGGQNRSRIIMLNEDGSLRWNSKEFINFSAVRITKLSNKEVLFTGFANSNDPQAPPKRGLAMIKINHLGKIQYSGLLNEFNQELSAANLDFLYTTNKSSYLAEKKKFGSSEEKIVITKFPTDWDSLSCYTKYPIEIGIVNTINHNTLPLLPNKSMNFIESNIILSVANAAQYSMLEHCRVSSTEKVIDLGPDTTLCPDEILVLTGPEGYNYNWNTGATSKSITVDKSGWYKLNAQFGCDNTNFSDSIFVDYFPRLELDIYVNKKTYFLDETLFAEAFGGVSGTYYWYINEVLIDSGNTFEYECDTNGIFDLTLIFIDDNGCSFSVFHTFRVSPETPSMPNVFTPNGDGRNERFTPFQSKGARYKLDIYNRNGTLISQNINQGWDGTTRNSTAVAGGVYFYQLFWEDNPQPKRGFVTVIK